MSEKTPRVHQTPSGDALGDLLRAADPAGITGQPGLDPIERANLRQRIIAAAEETPSADAWNPVRGTDRPAWLVPAIAAAVLVTAVGLAVWSLQGGDTGTSGAVAGGPAALPQPTAPVETTPAEPSTEAPTLPQDAFAGDTPITSATAVAEASPRAGVADEPQRTDEMPASVDVDTNPTAITVADNPSPPDRQARTLQFVAPRGTRIIWTLDPDFESPIAGQEPRQEKTR